MDGPHVLVTPIAACRVVALDKTTGKESGDPRKPHSGMAASKTGYSSIVISTAEA